jgi:hypothetical protein
LSWYPIASMRRLRKAVLVRWGWVEPFQAVLLENNPRRWATLRRDATTGEIVTIELPPRNVKLWRRTWGGEYATVSDRWLEERGWGPEPAAWQPIGQWPDPLPDPLPTGDVDDKVRMVSIGLVNFDAATAAREMEAERQRARNERDRRDHSDEDGLPWWWSPAELVYQPSGHVTRKMAEGRVMRAVAWCLGGSAPPQLAKSRFFAEMAAAAEELSDMAPQAVRFTPLQQDIGDFLAAMSWFTKLNPKRDEDVGMSREQKLLIWRSRPVALSFGEIGNQFSVSSQRAHQVYRRAIDKVTALANQAEGVDAPIAKLRQRNRAARATSFP